MKRGISVELDYDRRGAEIYVVKKKRGKLTFEEIQDAMIEKGFESYFGLVLPCIDEDSSQYWDDDLPGDAVVLYDMDRFLEYQKMVRQI